MQLREVVLFSKCKYVFFLKKILSGGGTCLKDCATNDTVLHKPYLLQEYPSFSSLCYNTFNMIFQNKNKVGVYSWGGT